RGRGGFTGVLAGWVTVAVPARAHCPVTVVRGTATADGPVVVGLDGSRESDAALAFAVEEAAARRAPLVALRAWGDLVLDAYTVPPLDRDAVDAAERETLTTTLAGWSEKFPDVEMRIVISHQPPASALIGLSSDAQLVVVGSHGHGAFSGLMLGSVSQAMIQHAHSPVAVVRAGPVVVE
ncbi:MAG: universal stress protein, partial [Pseudonocardia sediminis]